MLATTSAWTAIVYTNQGLKEWVFKNGWAMYVCLLVVISISCGMTCCFYKQCKRYPLNYLLLGTYTIFHAYLIGGICASSNPEALVAAAVCTTGMFIALTLYACFTKTDFTYLGGVLCVSTIMIILFLCMFSWFIAQSKI